MKFTQKLAGHLTPEWRAQYINYMKLKEIILLAAENSQNLGRYDQYQYLANFDVEFFEDCEAELTKVNNFFDEKLTECIRSENALQTELNNAMMLAGYIGPVSQFDLKTVLPRHKLKSFEFAFSELYLQLILLQNYQALNHTGFRKILKKHDKHLHSTAGDKWFRNHVNTAPFYTNHMLTTLITRTENTMTNNVMGGNRTRAMQRLRVPRLRQESHPWTTFRVGVYSGAFTVLFIVVFISVYALGVVRGPAFETFLRLHRAPLAIILHTSLVAINILGWCKVGINHVLIFELNPRDHIMAVHLIEVAVVLALLWIASSLAYLYAVYLGVPPSVFTVTLILLMACFVLNPLHIFHYTSRIWLVKLVGRVFAPPFYEVLFAEFWLAEQMLSISFCLLDLKYMICFALSEDGGFLRKSFAVRHCDDSEQFVLAGLILSIPPWLRLLQCLQRYRHTGQSFPFLWNAGKYATSFVSIFFSCLLLHAEPHYDKIFDNPYTMFVVVSLTVESLCYLYWDMTMDYGIFQKFTAERFLLREQLLYPPWFYYFGIIQNFLIRFFWIVRIYLWTNRALHSYELWTVHMFLELFRRFIWNYFRLENEHLFNSGNFRAVRDIFVAPIDPDELVTSHLSRGGKYLLGNESE